MPKIVIPAARVKQGGLTLFATTLKVKDIVTKDFYSVETLDPADANSDGYQRLLNTAGAKNSLTILSKDRIAMMLSCLHRYSWQPTKPSRSMEKDNTIEIDTSVVCPLSVVDGQHRLEGLKMAALKDARVLDFEIPVNIATSLPKIAQMCHFLIVNTTQKRRR